MSSVWGLSCVPGCMPRACVPAVSMVTGPMPPKFTGTLEEPGPPL